MGDGTWSWWWDLRPGSPGTLLKLYREVPATEEYDVRESDLDAARLEWWREVAREIERLDRAATTAQEAPASAAPEESHAEDDEDAEPLTPGQAIGMLEHLLGAEVIDPDDPDDPGREPDQPR